MKILHCLAQLPSMTGSGIYYSVLVNELGKRGHENALIYAYQKNNAVTFSAALRQYPVEFLSKELPFPIPGMSDEMPYQSTLYSKMSEEDIRQWMQAFQKKLLQAKEEFNPDIIISHHLFMLTALVRRCFPEKVLIGIGHGTDIRQIKKHPYFLEKYMKGIENLDACFVIAPKDRIETEKLIKIPQSKIMVTGGGFDRNIFYRREKRLSKDIHKIELLYAGKIADAKGVYELAAVMPHLEKKYDNFRLTVVGNADKAQEERLRKLSGYSSRFEILPALSQKELAQKMRDSDIFILPSYYEGLGLVNIEALACGCRVVSTEIEGLIWLLEGEINKSKAIEYVALPKMYDVDKPFEEEKEDFTKRLYKKVGIQIERVCRGDKISDKTYQRIETHSWSGIVLRIENRIFELMKGGSG